ncbi:hypothetical protein ACN42_g2460 [Penicillium freii]|uniref:Uncharacterized protein n=1 Tax=Penicillium freii TaxID=48697 RepID=A0A117NQU5_PENFR|nr:hypothetical protein ACN42_g2460 [Penicillium freii]
MMGTEIEGKAGGGARGKEMGEILLVDAECTKRIVERAVTADELTAVSDFELTGGPTKSYDSHLAQMRFCKDRMVFIMHRAYANPANRSGAHRLLNETVLVNIGLLYFASSYWN